MLQKELDIALRQLILVPAGAGGKDSVVAEALGAGEANIDESTPSGQAGDDVAHTDLASFAAEEIAGYEDLLPGGLGGDLQTIDRAGEGDQAEPGFPHVPTEGERAAPLRRHEGHVIGQATEGLRRGLLEQVPVDDVGRSGPPPVGHLVAQVHPPQVGVQVGVAVLVDQALLGVDGEPAVVGVHGHGVLLAPRAIARLDLDDSFPELPAEEDIGAVHGQGLGSQEIGGLQQEPVYVGLGQGGSHECSHAIGHLHLRVHCTVHSADRHAAHKISPFNVVSLCVLNAYSSAYFLALTIS